MGLPELFHASQAEPSRGRHAIAISRLELSLRALFRQAGMECQHNVLQVPRLSRPA